MEDPTCKELAMFRSQRNARSSGLHCWTHMMADVICELLSAVQFRILRLPNGKSKDKYLQNELYL